MRNSMKKLENIPETLDILNQSSIDADNAGRLVDQSQSSSLLDPTNRHQTNAVDEHHHHHESLDVESLGNSLSSELQLNNFNENDFDEDFSLEITSCSSIDDMIQIKIIYKKSCQLSQQLEQEEILVYDGDVIGNGRLELYEENYKRLIFQKSTIYGFSDLILILHLFGHRIKYYKVTSLREWRNPNKKYREFMFQWVPKLCKNIVNVEINIKNGYYALLTFDVMATNWEKLKKINIKYLSQPVDENFYNLLSKNKQLKTLTVWFDCDPRCRWNDKIFSYLPRTIEEIELKSILISDEMEFGHLILASKNLTSLQSIKFSHVPYLTDAMVAAIAHIKSLTHLSLYDVDYHESENTIDSIANLKDLKSLVISCNDHLYLVRNVLTVVMNCKQLEYLVIPRGMKIKDEEIAAIAELKKLKCLGINARILTSRSIISPCSSLEVFRCRWWKINDSDAIELLKKATNLRFVDFGNYRYHNLTKNVLEAANKIANERKKNILCITGLFGPENIIDIDTPYFKYFSFDTDLPLAIFPNNIRNF